MADLIRTDGKIVKDVDISSLKKIQNHVGGYIEYCPVDAHSFMYVDEEGLLKDSNYSFNVKCSEGISYPLMGKGLILGTDAEGESIECQSKLDDIKSRVTFNGKVAISEGDRGFTVVPYEEYLKALTNQKLLEILDTKGNA